MELLGFLGTLFHSICREFGQDSKFHLILLASFSMMNAIIFCKNACFFFYNLQPKISMILVLNIHVNKTYIPSSSAVLHFLFCPLFLCQSPCSASGESETKPQNLKQLTGRPSKLDKWKKGAEIPSVHHADDHLMKFTA